MILSTISIISSFVIVIIGILHTYFMQKKNQDYKWLKKTGIILLMSAIVTFLSTIIDNYDKYLDTISQKTEESRQLILIAEQTENAIEFIMDFLTLFLTENGAESTLTLFKEQFDKQHKEIKNNPSIDQILAVFSKTSFLENTNVDFNTGNIDTSKTNITWIELFSLNMRAFNTRCTKISDRYGGINHELLRLNVDLERKSEYLLGFMELPELFPYYNIFWENGIYDQTILNLYQEFFECILKTKRLINKVKTENKLH